MFQSQYHTIDTKTDGAVLTATIQNDPINLIDWKFQSNFNDLPDNITANTKIKVLVVQATEAAQYGWVNRAFSSVHDLNAFIASYVARVSKFPAAGLLTTKKRMNEASRSSNISI